MYLVTSYTRETVDFAIAAHVAPCVMSVALNKSRNPADLKLVPYEQVLRQIKQDQINVVQTTQGFICKRMNGLNAGKPCATAAEAMIAYWAQAKATPQAQRHQTTAAPARKRAS